MESVSIIGIGIATMDIYCYKNKMYPGGNEYNIAYNAKKQGAKAAFMGVFANDKVGEILEETLQKEQIDTSHSHHEEGSSGYALVDLKDGDRVFIDWNKKGVTDLYPFEFTKEEIEYIKEFDIRLGDVNGNIGNLSGGNAQKVIIARELSANPKLLIACQPTRGVDIGSIEFIHKQILKFRDAGNTVILISSELSEIMSLSDRVIVMYKGKISGEVSPKEVSMAAMGLLMAGIGKEEQDHEKER